MSDIFNSEPVPSIEDLVGEGKKYKTMEDFVRSRLEADKTIEARERENAELREEAKRAQILEEVLDRLGKNSPSENQPPRQQPETPSADPAKPLSEEELATQVRNVLNADKQAEEVRRNVTEVTERMLTEFGTPEKANEYVTTKARELGVSVDFLQSVAAKSPKSFFVQVGLERFNEKPVQARTVSGDVNTAALQDRKPEGQPGTYSWYANLRKTDRELYFSPKIQNQLMKDAAAYPGGMAEFRKT